MGTRIPPRPIWPRAWGWAATPCARRSSRSSTSGLLERRRGSGTYVVGDRELAGAVARRLADAHLADVVEVRRALEVEAARSAAGRRTPADLAALDEALARREAAWRDGNAAAFVDADVAFHQAVVATAHNRILAELYDDFSAALHSSLTEQFGGQLEPGATPITVAWSRRSGPVTWPARPSKPAPTWNTGELTGRRPGRPNASQPARATAIPTRSRRGSRGGLGHDTMGPDQGEPFVRDQTQPGVLPLRPLTTGEVLDAGVVLLRAHGRGG